MTKLTWDSGKQAVMDLTTAGAFPKAFAAIKKLETLEDATGEKCTSFGAVLESIGDAGGETAYYELALTQFERYAAMPDCYKSAANSMINRVREKIGLRLGTITLADTRAEKEKAAVKPDELLAKMESLARKRRTGAWHRLSHERKHLHLLSRMTEHFEMLGDTAASDDDWSLAEEFYHVAMTANRDHDIEQRIYEKRTQMELAVLQRMLAKPPSEDPLPGRLTWGNGQERMQALALHGRFQEAEELLSRLERTRDEWEDRGMAVMSQMEWIGDQVSSSHPEVARWFYKKAADQFDFWVSSATSGGEGMARSAETNTAAEKLAALAGRR